MNLKFVSSTAVTPWHRLAAAGVAGLLVLVGGCADKKAQRERDPGVPVTVATVVRKTVPVQVTSIGTAEAYSTVAIKSHLDGQILEVHFAEGQDVKAGDLLFTMDRRPFEADLKRAESTLAKDQAQALNAKAQSARYAELQKQGVVAREQADAMITNAQAMDATVEADRAAAEYSRVQLQYTSIYAPISGRTGNLVVHAGNQIKANDAALVTINQISPIYTDFAVPEQVLSEVKRYMARGKLSVVAQLPNEPPITGVLTFVDNTVDAATGTIKLKGTFANVDRKLWPGQFVNMILTLTTDANALVIPTQAIQSGQQGQYVFVVKGDHTAEPRQIVVERTVQNDAVVSKGLQLGETVVTDGQSRLLPGSPVEIKSAAIAPPVSSLDSSVSQGTTSATAAHRRHAAPSPRRDSTAETSTTNGALRRASKQEGQ